MSLDTAPVLCIAYSKLMHLLPLRSKLSLLLLPVFTVLRRLLFGLSDPVSAAARRQAIQAPIVAKGVCLGSNRSREDKSVLEGVITLINRQ